MDARIRFVIRHKDGESMAALCREFQISRKTGYKIFERYEECGLEGLTCYPCVRTGQQGNGAGDGIRTRDINLGKVALYQLSYSRAARRKAWTAFIFAPGMAKVKCL